MKRIFLTFSALITAGSLCFADNSTAGPSTATASSTATSTSTKAITNELNQQVATSMNGTNSTPAGAAISSTSSSQESRSVTGSGE